MSDSTFRESPVGSVPSPEDPKLVNALRKWGPERVVFGRFKLVEELGSGGMAVVWLARDERLGLEVALKFLPGMVASDREALRDLRREITKGLRLTHSGIVRVYDLHEDTGEKLAAIAMEYIDGPTLADEKGRQPHQRFEVEGPLISWTRTLCEVLAYVHEEARVVHRDLKPGNLMLTSAGRLKVADFGIAATLCDSQSRLTRHPGRSGTPVYMSPQQAVGSLPTAADDIYALGATLYELLTSKPPFFRGSTAIVLNQVASVIPPPMHERRVEFEAASGIPIPPEWEETIAACLAKNPADRPANAREVAERLGLGVTLNQQENGRAASIEPTLSNGNLDALAPAAGAAREPSAYSHTIRARGKAPDPAVAPDDSTPRRAGFGAAGWSLLLLALLFLVWAASRFWGTVSNLAPVESASTEASPRPAPATPTPEPAGTPRAVSPTPTPERAATPMPHGGFVPPTESGLEAVASASADMRSAASASASSLAVPVAPLASGVAAGHAAATRPRGIIDPLVKATKETPFENGLGMRFVPVPIKGGPTAGQRILFSIWDTRVQDYSVFAKETQREWRKPNFEQGPAHPAVCVSWDDAVAFCKWLSEKEGHTYRLPSDHEWSCAVGIGDHEDAAKSPKELSAKPSGYPWGSRFPPPKNFGNYAPSLNVDPYDYTSPVGSFAPNRYGLFDLSGNVSQWCADWFDPAEKAERFVRSSSWLDDIDTNLRSSARTLGRSSDSDPSYAVGFRCVLVAPGS